MEKCGREEVSFSREKWNKVIKNKGKSKCVMLTFYIGVVNDLEDICCESKTTGI